MGHHLQDACAQRLHPPVELGQRSREDQTGVRGDAGGLTCAGPWERAAWLCADPGGLRLVILPLYTSILSPVKLKSHLTSPRRAPVRMV